MCSYMLYRSFHKSADLKGVELSGIGANLEQLDQAAQVKPEETGDAKPADDADAAKSASNVSALAAMQDQLTKQRVRAALVKRVEMFGYLFRGLKIKVSVHFCNCACSQYRCCFLPTHLCMICLFDLRWSMRCTCAVSLLPIVSSGLQLLLR